MASYWGVRMGVVAYLLVTLRSMLPGVTLESGEPPVPLVFGVSREGVEEERRRFLRRERGDRRGREEGAGYGTGGGTASGVEDMAARGL